MLSKILERVRYGLKVPRPLIANDKLDLGAQLGVPTPANTAIMETLTPYAQGREL